ncbi:hypothetical protein [Sunxiuqinia elliptica]|uniref:Uncharacterized protein n=1 Tax=Sunxiuqinia elliptica TaxID=655355 RepID=A0A4R6GUM6_9BACT|nr:hypothetical protein [Sunxiuqinia elliptica]TDN98947.1 hypothetical protein DET52_10775 [Sunxiuqinia elliptica]TDO56388.1 hypothetical protein DET65_3939 [Sunxiuqinia elliptica]
MKKSLFLLVLAVTLFACEKDDDGIKLQLNTESCTLDNETSYAEIRIDRGEGSLQVASTDSDIAEILYDENDKNIFYIIGHNQGTAAVLVVIFNDEGEENTKTIDVYVREAISYERFLMDVGVYLKKGESRKFGLPFTFDKNYSVVADNSAVIDNDGVATVSSSVEMGNKFKVEAKAVGSTSFNICKGKVVIFSARVFVVDEYDLFIPESENNQLTFDLPFIAGVNGITIWRGSGHYSAKVVDETIAIVKSVTTSDDHFDQQNNSAVVRVTPLKSGKTKLLVTDEVTGQTSAVNVVVN